MEMIPRHGIEDEYSSIKIIICERSSCYYYYLPVNTDCTSMP